MKTRQWPFPPFSDIPFLQGFIQSSWLMAISKTSLSINLLLKHSCLILHNHHILGLLHSPVVCPQNSSWSWGLQGVMQSSGDYSFWGMQQKGGFDKIGTSSCCVSRRQDLTNYFCLKSLFFLKKVNSSDFIKYLFLECCLDLQSPPNNFKLWIKKK